MKSVTHFGCIVIAFIITLSFCSLTGCSGGSGQPTQNFQAQVVMGPIIGADVFVYRTKDRVDSIETGLEVDPIAIGKTRDDDSLDNAGWFEVEIPLKHLEEPLYVVVSGGYDIDADDNGVEDEEYTYNTINFEFLVPSAHNFANLRLTTKFNPLLLHASQYAIGNLFDQGEISNEEIIKVLRSVAKAFLIGEDRDGDGNVDDLDGDGLPDDINSDGHVDWKDIVTFNPTDGEHRAKCRMPWEYLLAQLERQRNGYTADLQLSYVKYFTFDPHVVIDMAKSGIMHPLDYNNDGEWNDEEDFYDFFQLIFSTSLHDYTLSDLVAGQGMIGGNVLFPESVDLFYGYFDYDADTTECNYEQNNTTGNLPLTLNCIEFVDDIALLDNSLSVDVGGFIYDPPYAPEGVYNVNYTTGDPGDRKSHEESFYIYEITEKTYVYVIPQVFIDEQKRIDYITLRFEDVYGNVLNDPPILGCNIWMNPTWSTSEEANKLLRGNGYYNSDLNLYNTPLKYLDITQPIFPQNNGNKIFVEDVVPIYIGITTGDGVSRSFGFGWDGNYLPQIETLEINGTTVSATYISSSETDKPVDRIRYRFDNTDWVEVAGATINLEKPAGATTFYVTATDDSGFYSYPPKELSVE